MGLEPVIVNVKTDSKWVRGIIDGTLHIGNKLNYLPLPSKQGLVSIQHSMDLAALSLTESLV